jgi:hypothetical protein
MVYIVTYSLPDLSYCETQLGRRPHDILLICHAKFTHKAMTLQERFPDIHVRVHLEVHGKLLLIAPDTVYLGSTNFGDSGWEEFTVGIRSVEAVQFYEQSFGCSGLNPSCPLIITTAMIRPSSGSGQFVPSLAKSTENMPLKTIPTTSFELWSSWTCFGFPCLSVRQVRPVGSLLNPGDQLPRVMPRVGCEG